MEKFKEFLKKERFVKTSNVFSIIIGAILIIYIVYEFISSIADLRSIPGSLIFKLVWFGLGVILISSGLRGFKKQNTSNINENVALEIPHRVFWVSIPIVVFIICLTQFIIISSGNAWDISIFLGIWLFGFQFPLTLVAIFTKNKSTLRTVSILSLLFGVGIFLTSITL